MQRYSPEIFRFKLESNMAEHLFLVCSSMKNKLNLNLTLANLLDVVQFLKICSPYIQVFKKGTDFQLIKTLKASVNFDTIISRRMTIIGLEKLTKMTH